MLLWHFTKMVVLLASIGSPTFAAYIPAMSEIPLLAHSLFRRADRCQAPGPATIKSMVSCSLVRISEWGSTGIPYRFSAADVRTVADKVFLAVGGDQPARGGEFIYKIYEGGKMLRTRLLLMEPVDTFPQLAQRIRPSDVYAAVLDAAQSVVSAGSPRNVYKFIANQGGQELARLYISVWDGSPDD
jgi:hypothetical protein